MLSGIKLVSKEEAERLEAEDRKNQKKEHKHKHKKKHKKEKKDRRHDSDSDDSRSPERDEYSAPAGDLSKHVDDQLAGGIDNNPPLPSSSLQREDWMSIPMGRSLAPSADKEKEKEPPVDPDHPKISARELNPDLRKLAGDANDNANAAPTTTAPGVVNSGVPPPAVGDGGASWRMKALRRAQSQAGEEGKGLSDVVAERWGSLGNLTAELAQGTAAHGMAHARAARERRREADTSTGGNSSRHMSDVKSGKSQMRRPSEGDLEKMSWRREKERNGEKKQREQSYRSGSESGRDVHSRGGYRSRSSADEERRESDRERERPIQRREEEKRKLNRNDNDNVEAVLRAAAPEMNIYRNDGSFLDQFTGTGRDDGTVGQEEMEKKQEPREVQQEFSKQQYEEEKDKDAMTAPPPLPTKSNNLSAAAMLRARLGGRQHPATATAGAAAAAPSAEQSRKYEKEETVILPLIDASGRAAPGAFGRESASAAAGATTSTRPIKRVERYDQDGQRKRYFADDDAVDLDTLVKRTKYGTTEDIDATMARNIAKSARFKETDLDADAEYDWDAGLDLADGRHIASKDARRRGSAHEEVAKKEKQRQIREYTKFQSALDRCTLCFTSKLRQKHLTLAIGTVAYLALPSRGRLVPGHCQIIPAEHIASTRSTDESTWTEIRNFKKCLLQMFIAQGMDCIFIETALGVGGGGQDARAHAVVDCIPVPQDVFTKAPMYFRKAVDDATSEWAQHASKRMIDTSKKGLRGAIPPSFPYFHVEFGLASGFVHVIDNPEEFDRDFGRSVLIGLLRLPEEDMHRRAKKESQRLQEQWAAEFRSQFDEFDWTKQL